MSFNANLSLVHANKALESNPGLLADGLGADLVVIGKSPEKHFQSDVRALSYEIACRTPCPVASV